MIQSKHTHISSADLQLLEVLAQESNKVVCAFSLEGELLFTSTNYREIVLKYNIDSFFQNLYLKDYLSLENAVLSLSRERKTNRVFNATLKANSEELKFEGKFFLNEKSSFVYCTFSLIKNYLHEELVQKKIIENTSDVVAYYNKNEELVYISPSILQLTGYTSKEMMEMQQLTLSHPDDKERIEELLKRDIADNLPQNRFTYRIRHKNGTYLWVEVVSRRNYDKNGKLIEAILNFRSIQGQVEAEQKLQDVEQLYESIVNQAPFGVVIHDKERVLFANNAAADIVKASSGSELVGVEINKVIHPRYKELVEQRMKVLETEEILPLREEKFICLDGSVIDVEVMGGVVKYKNKDCVQTIFRDISQRKQVESLLSEQQAKNAKINHELDKFLYSTAHDLRSPIASALGLINLCEQDDNQQNVKSYFSLLKLSIQKLDNFIRDISDLSRNAKSELILEDIDPDEVTQRSAEMIRILQYERKISVDIHWNKKYTLRTDKERLQIILNNLFSNILRFYNPSNDVLRVKVKGEVDIDSCIFSVEDNGIGIPQEHIGKIFNMFYRGHDTQAGSGLGLYIVKETVEKLGGSIKVESDTRKGTCFAIVLPNYSAE